MSKVIKRSSDFIKKNYVYLIIIFVLLISFAAIATYIHSLEIDRGTDPICALNEKRSYVAVTGEGYILGDNQEKEYKQEENKREEQNKIQSLSKPLNDNSNIQETGNKDTDINSDDGDSIEADEDPKEDENLAESGDAGDDEASQGDKDSDEDGGNTSGGGQGEGSGEEGDNTGGDQENSKLPAITCSLTDGEKIDGNLLSFTVKAVSYKKEILDSFDVKVTVNGSKIYSSGSQNGKISYRTTQNLRNGNNEVIITAEDSEGNSATKIFTIVIDTSGEMKKGGTMRVSLCADVIGIGNLFDVNVDFYEGENLPYVIDRAFKKAGISYTYGGTFDYGFYLNRIFSAGITDGYVIPESIMKKLKDENCSWVGYETDSLGEKDFYYYSGWMYKMDGVFRDGFSTIPAEDGSEIIILFTLNLGKEYNGEWFSGDW